MRALWRFIKDSIGDEWFAPMFWPLNLFMDSGRFTYNWPWSLDVLYFSIFAPLTMVLTLLMIPVQLLMFIGIVLTAVVVAPYHLYKALMENE